MVGVGGRNRRCCCLWGSFVVNVMRVNWLWLDGLGDVFENRWRVCLCI